MKTENEFEINTVGEQMQKANNHEVIVDDEQSINQRNNLTKEKLIRRIVLFSILGIVAVLIIVLPSVFFTSRKLNKLISVQDIKKIEVVSYDADNTDKRKIVLSDVEIESCITAINKTEYKYGRDIFMRCRYSNPFYMSIEYNDGTQAVISGEHFKNKKGKRIKIGTTTSELAVFVARVLNWSNAPIYDGPIRW